MALDEETPAVAGCHGRVRMPASRAGYTKDRLIFMDFVIGTRPDVIKCSPLIAEIARRGCPFRVLYTGQHTDYEMFGTFLQELGIAAITKLVNADEAGEYAGPVLVYGDTDSAFQQAYHARRSRKKVVHIEAGLRRFDEYMYEEINRILIDHLSNLCFAPTHVAARNLYNDGIPPERVIVTGNLISDALNIVLEQKQYRLPERPPDVLVTIHRRENLYNPGFRGLLEQVERLQREFHVLWPVHPHTEQVLRRVAPGMDVRCEAPCGYLEFVGMMIGCRLVLTDSGGVSEEACILGKRCVIVRKSTERPELLSLNAALCPEYSEVYRAVVEGLAKGDVPRQNPYLPPRGDSVAAFMADILGEL